MSSHEFLFDAATRFEQDGRPSAADQAYEALAWQYPEIARELLYQQGEQQWEAGDYSQAIETYERVVGMYPDNEAGERARERIPEWLYQWGEQQWEAGDYSQAIETYNRIIRDYPGSEYGEIARRQVPEYLYEWASQEQEVERYEEAITLYEQIVNEHPESPYKDPAEAGIITSQLLIILGTDPGELPPIDGLYSPGLGDPRICIRNDTNRYMTVRMSGPSTVRMDVPPGEQRCQTVEAGHYSFTVSVDDSSVRSFLGYMEFKLNYEYSRSYYIATGRGKPVAGLISSEKPRGTELLSR